MKQPPTEIVQQCKHFPAFALPARLDHRLFADRGPGVGQRPPLRKTGNKRDLTARARRTSSGHVRVHQRWRATSSKCPATRLRLLVTEAQVMQKLGQIKHVYGHAETPLDQLLNERRAPTPTAEPAGLWPGFEPCPYSNLFTLARVPFEMRVSALFVPHLALFRELQRGFARNPDSRLNDVKSFRLPSNPCK